MIKKCFGFLFLVLSLFAFSQEKNADIVVLLDNSGTMLPYFSEINEKVLQGICENFVRIDDSFHLLSFNEKTFLEISQKINTQKDIEKVVSRFSLLYPLGPYSNFIEALSYSRQYISSLNAYTQKVLVIISDGIFNPPQTSSYYNQDPQSLENAIQSNLNALQSQGSLVYFIKAPFPEGLAVKDFTGQLKIAKLTENEDGLVLAGKSDDFQTKTSSLEMQDGNKDETFYEYATNLQNNTGVISSDLEDINNEKENFIANAFKLPKISTHANLGKQNYKLKFPLIVENTSDKTINLQLDKVLINGQNVLENTSFISIKGDSTKTIFLKLVLPESFNEGEQSLSAQFEFADKVRTTPQNLNFSLILVKQSAFASTLSSTGFYIFIIILVILIIIALIILILRLTNNLSLRSKEDETKQVIKKAEPAFGNIDPTKVSTSKLSLPEIANHLTAVEKSKNEKTQSNMHNQTSQHKNATIDDLKNAQKNATMDDLRNAQKAFAKTSSMETTKFSENKTSLSLPSRSEQAKNQSLLKPKTENQTLVKNETENDLRNAQNAFKENSRLALPVFAGNENPLSLPSIKSLKPQTKIKAANSNEKIPTKKDGSIILELYVEGQTKNIGSRNIHSLSAGSRKTLGGGLSIFSIFFIKVPASIAEVRYDGQTCSLALLKPKYFPEAESNIIEDCLDKPITIISDHGYMTKIKLTEYQSETEKLNELLLSIVPEEDKDKYLNK